MRQTQDLTLKHQKNLVLYLSTKSVGLMFLKRMPLQLLLTFGLELALKARHPGPVIFPSLNQFPLSSSHPLPLPPSRPFFPPFDLAADWSFIEVVSRIITGFVVGAVALVVFNFLPPERLKLVVKNSYCVFLIV